MALNKPQRPPTSTSKEARRGALLSRRGLWVGGLVGASVLAAIFSSTRGSKAERAAIRSAAPPTSSSRVVAEETSLAGAPPETVSRMGEPSTFLASRDAGYERIERFKDEGHLELGAQFAIGSPSELRRDLVIAAFHEWGRAEPERALRAVIQISNTEDRQLAFEAVLSGWARTAPERMAELAMNLPASDERTTALTKALRSWMNRDPWKAGDWIIAHESAIPIAEELFRKDRR